MTEDESKPVDVVKVQKEYRRKTIMEHLVGPFGSVIFHILIVFAAIHLMVFTQQEKAPEIEVMMTDPETVDLEDFNKELEKMEEIQEFTDVTTPVDVNVPVETPTAIDQANVGAAPSEDVSTDLNALNVESMTGALVMKGLYAGRSASGRASALGTHGGDVRTEQAVLKALEWLRKNQNPDGSWSSGTDNKVAMAGLGLLTFLAHGETTASEKYGATVEKAIRFLAEKQREDGIFGTLNPGAAGEGGGAGSYAHAIATYGLAEAFGITRIPSLKPAMDKAVAVIIKGQQPGGGWDYQYRKTDRKDTSVAGWQIQALKAAYIAGSETPGIKDALDKSAVYLRSMQNPETGKVGYSSPGSGNDPITAVGVLCLQLTGYGEDKAVEKGLQYMRGWDLNWEKPGYHSAMYGWYYITQAKFHKGGADWQSWNQDLRKILPAMQNDDGSWKFPTEEHGHQAGPAYATTLAALSLQVYYRFLPTYKPVVIEKPSEAKSDDVTVEIN